MTYKQYFTATLTRLGANTSDIDLLLVNQDLNGSDAVDVQKAKIAMHTEIANIIPLANISEADMSITWNFEALKFWYKSLSNELGLPDILADDDGMDVDDKSYMW